MPLLEAAADVSDSYLPKYLYKDGKLYAMFVLTSRILSSPLCLVSRFINYKRMSLVLSSPRILSDGRKCTKRPIT